MHEPTTGDTGLRDARLQGLRVAILTAGPSGGATGGAERFYEGLRQGFEALGCEATLVPVPADEPTFEQIVANYAACQALDLSDWDLVVSTKVPTYAVRHPRHVLYLVHTVRVFDDMFATAFPEPTPEQMAQRARLHALDFAALSGVRARFAIGHEVARRLARWRGLTCEVLHPPLGFDGFRPGPTGDYFFLAGRLHPWKRVDLLIEAVRGSSRPLTLRLAGTGEAEATLRAQAGGDPRIEFLGRISDDELVAQYAGALAVPFVPRQEDYGYVTLEAFASGKPVLTCTDSGEPTCFVRHGETGLVCPPDAPALRRALEWLSDHPAEAARMGEAGRQRVQGLSWPATARRLAEAALADTPPAPAPRRVAVLDMQPIDPPVGGGRLRLLGLYHGLGDGVDTRYVGTYDWPGERRRRHALSPTLTETDVPLSDAHHEAANVAAAACGGKVVIDLAFSEQAVLSPDYLAAAREAMADAGSVVFSHPWVYPLVADSLQPGQVVVYDSHNVEGYLRAQLLDERNPAEAALLRRVVQDEFDIGQRADWIWACSHEDLLRFHRLYGFDPARMRVVPNGVMAGSMRPPTTAERAAERAALGLPAEGLVAIFLGSGYGPNLEAAAFIDRSLAARLPGVCFVIAGGVGDALSPSQPNVRVTGRLDEAAKNRWLRAADLALNPMMSGSGTNIKMFDFMALGLPVVTTATGARGIETAGREVMRVVAPQPADFAAAITALQDAATRERLGREARQCVEDGYAWEHISAQLGLFLAARERLAGQPQPLYSVVVPTYERHDQLDDLVRHLQAQIERDFEVVIVDQSATPWPGAQRAHGFALTYHHSPVRGAVRARNTGAWLAQGAILAFVDDDCQPAPDWLLAARAWFADPQVAGVEGLIHSDHRDDPDWRPVTNVGFEGIGFMTANLMVRAGVFQYLGGFDLQFDRPHFREDTDFGWRMQALGRVPYAADVRVFHPAQPRSNVRESAAERARMFRKDALLYRKHPQRYRQLFEAERHYQQTPGFRTHFLGGFVDHGITPPAWLAEFGLDGSA